MAMEGVGDESSGGEQGAGLVWCDSSSRVGPERGDTHENVSGLPPCQDSILGSDTGATLDARSAIGRGFDLLLWATAQEVAGEGGGDRQAGVPLLDTHLAQDWTALVSQPIFTWPTEWALAVIQCESGGNPLAYNPAGPYVGLWQVLNGSSDPYTNALQAHYQYRQWMEGIRAVSPWPTCGPYRP